MKKYIVFIVILFTCSIVLISCNDSDIDFVEQGPFVKLELYSASEGNHIDHFPKIIIVSNDGKVHGFTKEVVSWDEEVILKIDNDVPEINKDISTEEVEEIKHVIEENRFFSLPTDVTDYDVMDGDGSRITVYEKGQEKEIGGENSSNKRYNAIENIIFQHVEDEFNNWVTETEDYLIKLNEYE